MNLLPEHLSKKVLFRVKVNARTFKVPRLLSGYVKSFNASKEYVQIGNDWYRISEIEVLDFV